MHIFVLLLVLGGVFVAGLGVFCICKNCLNTYKVVSNAGDFLDSFFGFFNRSQSEENVVSQPSSEEQACAMLGSHGETTKLLRENTQKQAECTKKKLKCAGQQLDRADEKLKDEVHQAERKHKEFMAQQENRPQPRAGDNACNLGIGTASYQGHQDLLWSSSSDSEQSSSEESVLKLSM